MTNLEKKEKTLVLIAFWLIFIHLIVSIIFVIQNFVAANKGQTTGSLQLSAFGWILSIVVCLIVLLLLLSSLNYSYQYEQTPCPLQLSYPSNSADRTDIKNFINDVNTPPPNKSEFVTPSGSTPLQPYDNQRVYIIFTKYYIKNSKLPQSIIEGIIKNLPLPDNIIEEISKYNNIPVGYVDDNKIYTLEGKEVWPEPDPSLIPHPSLS